jgi:hypothetical protein
VRIRYNCTIAVAGTSLDICIKKMRLIYLCLTGLLCCTIVNAQPATVNPAIKEGAVITYAVQAGRQDMPMTIRIEKMTADSISFTWSIYHHSGRFRMPAPSVQQARHNYWNEPLDGEDIVMADSVAIVFMSQACRNDLVKTGKMIFDGQEYEAKKDFSGKNFGVECLYAEGKQGTKLWISKHTIVPLIMAIEGNPFLVNIELQSVK